MTPWVRVGFSRVEEKRVAFFEISSVPSNGLWLKVGKLGQALTGLVFGQRLIIKHNGKSLQAVQRLETKELEFCSIEGSVAEFRELSNSYIWLVDVSKELLPPVRALQQGKVVKLELILHPERRLEAELFALHVDE